jgi:acyl carrier protein
VVDQADSENGASGQVRPGGDPTEEIMETVGRMVTEIIGEDYLMDIPITAETSFSDDLEMESIEFVALAERLSDHYGDTVDFVGWMAEMELEEIIALTVGQLVDFIAGCLT